MNEGWIINVADLLSGVNEIDKIMLKLLISHGAAVIGFMTGKRRKSRGSISI